MVRSQHLDQWPAQDQNPAPVLLSSARGERLLGVLGLEEHPVGYDTGDALIGPLDLELGTEL